MAGRQRKVEAAESEPGIRDLVSYRLARAASLMSRGAALRYRREFDVSLGEWRALALLATLLLTFLAGFAVLTLVLAVGAAWSVTAARRRVAAALPPADRS